MSVFDDLLAIRRFRERRAELAVFRQRQAHKEAQREYETAVQRLGEFRQWLHHRELGLYQDLCSRLVRVGEIDDVMHSVGAMRADERACVGKVEAAEELVERELDTLTARRHEHNEATRLSQKLMELERLHLADYMRERERKEDLEMEEAASVTRIHEDWEQTEGSEPS